jgi:hypothetical protein
MIKGLMGGPGLDVQGGGTSVPYINQNNSNPIQGMLRIWGSDMQVFDGNSWLNLSASYATVNFNGETQSVLQWAREQRNLQLERERKAREHPALQNALDAIKRAEANFDLLNKITNSEEAQIN